MSPTVADETAEAIDAAADTRPGRAAANSSPVRIGRRWIPVLVLAVSVLVGFVIGHGAGDDAVEVPDASSVDVGFLRDMADHHDQAVRLALVELDRGDAPALKGMALDVIAMQRYEIGLMEARLVDWGHGRGDLPRRAMSWMGMPIAVDRMPGMATQEAIESFASMDGSAADREFVRLMTAHHEGGIHMAEHALVHAEADEVRELAERIVKSQLLELRDLVRAAGELEA